MEIGSSMTISRKVSLTDKEYSQDLKKSYP
jgi:hypothetical protein